jgi:cytochrome b
MKMSERILIWDVPTRVFHWTLAASFAGAFLTGDSERWRDLHLLLGYLFAGLIGFRLLWGLLGTRYARFRSFLFRPGEVVAYARSLLGRSPRHYLGHNPLGSIVIFLLLFLGIVTAASGWAYYAELGGEWLEELHEAAAYAMLGLVGVHIAGVIVSSLLHRENLVRAMITGRKRGDAGQGIGRGHAWLGALLLLAVAAFSAWYPTTQGGAVAEHGSARYEQEDS